MSPSEPIRTCIGCGSRRPQRELVRYVLREGVVTVGGGPGRGAYTCPEQACIARAIERNAFGRRLRAATSIPADLAQSALGSRD